MRSPYGLYIKCPIAVVGDRLSNLETDSSRDIEPLNNHTLLIIIKGVALILCHTFNQSLIIILIIIIKEDS